MTLARFLCRWVPMDERHVRAAMEELEAHEFVIRAGTFPTSGPRPMVLFVARILDRAGPSDLTPAVEAGATHG